MKVDVDKFGGGDVQEPEWILDRTRSGSLYWRRESTENNSRVKFRYDVEIKEFQRPPHEMEEAEWAKIHMEPQNHLSMSFMGLLCVAITIVLPWYIMIGTG